MGRDFRLVWVGQAVSGAGTAVTALALPLLALYGLHAKAWQVAVLSACGYTAYALLALPAGAWLDRRARRPVVVAGDLGRFAVLASVPAAGALGVLTLWQLGAVALVVGGLGVVFDVAYVSWLPDLVTEEALVAANGRLGATDAAGRLAGPGIAGVLVAAVGASATIGFDAASFVMAAAGTLLVATRETRRPLPSSVEPVRRQVREGLGWLRSSSTSWRLVASSATANLFAAMWLAVETVFLVRTLGTSPGVTGAVLAVGSAGVILGGLTAARVSRHLGETRALVVCAALGGPFALLAPSATGLLGPWAVAAGLLGVTAASAVYSAGAITWRQRTTPSELRARVNAAVRFATSVVLPVGALLGGVLSGAVGVRRTMIVAAVGYGASALWLVPLVRRPCPVSRRAEPRRNARPVTGERKRDE